MVSVCMITKNESPKIRKCLKRLISYNFEIIVVDTGSTDDTKKIALEYTNKVYDFEWCDDFSAARNYSISKATNEYVLVIDSDEYLMELNKVELENLVTSHSKYVGRILRTNIQHMGNEEVKITERINRLFPKELYHYDGRIHEQIVANDDSEYLTYNVPLFVDHHGYDGDMEFRNKKTQRNIELLNKNLQENGEDPYTLYQLGKSYYMQQDYSCACEYFGKALVFDLNPKLEYVIDLVETYGYALINSKQFVSALQLENIYEEFGNRAEFKFLMGIIYMNNGLFQEAIIEFVKATNFKECHIEGVNSFKAFYNIGVIYECLGDVSNAFEYYGKCEGYEKAKSRIEILNTILY